MIFQILFVFQIMFNYLEIEKFYLVIFEKEIFYFYKQIEIGYMKKYFFYV